MPRYFTPKTVVVNGNISGDSGKNSGGESDISNLSHNNVPSNFQVKNNHQWDKEQIRVPPK